MRPLPIRAKSRADALASTQPVVFLMYHELEIPGRALAQSNPGYVRYIVRASDFQRQMELVKSDGWRGVTVGEAIRSFEQKTLAITFDDGCETDLLFAAPLLQGLGFGATVYVTTGWSGRSGYLRPYQLRELSTLGFEIGCHSMNHVYLTDLSDAALRRETADAKAQLEQVIGLPVEHLSCPGGRFDSRVAQAARNAGYLTVATSQIQANRVSTDRFALGRVAIMRDTSLADFGRICHDNGLWRLKMGVLLREAAMSVLGNSTYDRLRGAMLRTRPSGPV
jgi:peptidoglycan/xylan/chitin deacetylase (PgdA/CDA1 family)